MKTLSSKRPILSLLCIVVLVGNLFLQPIAAIASTAPATGQLSFARQVTVNGKEATAGQTLFNGDRVRVAGLGSAVINLGKRGRIELGKDTEFVMSLTDDMIGGEMAYGCMGIIASSGTNTSVKTNQGTVSSDGNEPNSYFLGQRGQQGRLIPSLGEAKMLMMDGKTENIPTGTSLDIDSPNGQNLLYRRNASTCTSSMSCACGLYDPNNNSTRASNQQQSNTPTSSPSSSAPSAAAGNGSMTFPLLFTAVLGASMAVFFANNPGGPRVRGNGLTCVDNRGFFCRQVSPTTPTTPPQQ